MARVLGDSLGGKMFSWLFFSLSLLQVSARKDIGVTMPSLCCPKNTSPGGGRLAHF